MNLVVSLPVNSIEFARASWEHGADAVKMHLNVHHHASDNHFGTLQQEWGFVEQLLEECPVPVGVVVGGSPDAVDADFANILHQKFDFLSLYCHDATSSILNQDKITRMLACNYTYSLDEISMFEKIGAEILEVSIVDPEKYGEPLTARDIIHYQQVIQSVSLPTLLPTQKKIKPSEVQLLNDIGFDAVMIGAVVTGQEINGFTEQVQCFRKAIDALV